jgi:hypothetical protein
MYYAYFEHQSFTTRAANIKWPKKYSFDILKVYYLVFVSDGYSFYLHFVNMIWIFEKFRTKNVQLNV